MTRSTLRKRTAERRPDLEGHQKKNMHKRTLALRLRSLRKKSNLTQGDIGRLSGLHQSAISRLESPDGPIPHLETITRYVQACGGHMALLISENEIEASSAAIAV